MATLSLGETISLTKLARTNSNTEYNPKEFAGLVLRIKEPKSTFIIFSSGNVICLGTKTKKEIEDSILQLQKEIGNKYKNPWRK